MTAVVVVPVEVTSVAVLEAAALAMVVVSHLPSGGRADAEPAGGVVILIGARNAKQTKKNFVFRTPRDGRRLNGRESGRWRGLESRERRLGGGGEGGMRFICG